jgi:hypothetical protein
MFTPYNQISDDPIEAILAQEFEENLLKFSSYVSIIHNKRLNGVNIFALLAKDVKIRNIFKAICQVDNDQTVLRLYLKYNPKLCRSKVVKNILRDIQ